MTVRFARPALATLICIAALLGCSPAQTPSEPAPPGGSEPTSTVESTATTSLDSLRLRLEPVAGGFDKPLFITHAGDDTGRLFVVEQSGRVLVLNKDGAVSARPFVDLSDRISTGGERGLLGLAFAPDYETSGRFYVDYTDRSGTTVVARFVATDPASDAPDLKGPEVLLSVEQPYSNHNGGCIAFAPDGRLWVGMGDGGSAGDPEKRAQDPRSLLGKMLSLDVEGSGVPEPKIVMRGLRNPWRFSFDPDSGDVWIGDVGQNAWEEVDVVPFAEAQGSNLGWSHFEGTHPYPPDAQTYAGKGMTFPAFEYSHDVGQSVTGGYVYRGADSPALAGTYVYGDFVAGWVGIARREPNGSVVQRIALDDPGVTPASFGEDEAGEIYVCDYNGAILKVTTR